METMRTDKQYTDSMKMLSIGWCGIVMTILLLLATQCTPIQAQTIYEVEYKSQANIILYKTQYQSQADYSYYITAYPSQANTSRNHWYQVPYKSQAELLVWWTRHPNQAHHKVWQAKYPSETR